MFSPKTTVAALCLAMTVLIDLPGLAQSMLTTDSAGNVIDSSGQIVGSTAVVTPVIVPLDGTVKPLVERQATSFNRPFKTTTKKTVISTNSPSVWVEDPSTTYTTVRRNELTNKYANVFDSRRVELARQITFINDLPLNMSLRAKLLEIAAKEATLKTDDCLTYDAALTLAQEFDQLSNQIYSLRQTDRLAPLVLTDVNGSRQVAVTDIPM